MVEVSADLVKDYFRRLGTNAPLSPAEERELAFAIEVGVLAREALSMATSRIRQSELRRLVATGDAAFERMIACNLRLVVSVARRYAGRGVELPDLIQDGNSGLIRAVRGFDPAKGYRFSTYAMFWIREAIEQGITVQSRVIKIPHYQRVRLAGVKKTYQTLVNPDGEPPSLEELAKESSLGARELEEMLKLDREVRSLHEPIGGEGGELGDVLSDRGARDPIISAIAKEEVLALRAALTSLDAPELSVVNHTFGLTGGGEMSIRDVASTFGMTKNTASHLLTDALRKLQSDQRLQAAIA